MIPTGRAALHGCAKSVLPMMLCCWLFGAGASEVPASVSASELARRLQQGADAPLVLDVRGDEAVRDGTIPDALNVGTNPEGFLPPATNQLIVLLVSQPVDPALVRAWAGRLQAAGHPVSVLEGGLPAWRAAGLTVAPREQSYVRPGTVPFVVPRGLCEMNEPAQEFR